MTTYQETPFEGGGWAPPILPPAEGDRRAAMRTLARAAGEDREGLCAALEALGLIPYRVSGEAREA